MTADVWIAEHQRNRSLYDVWADGKLFAESVEAFDLWEMRVRAYESLGCTRSDAQSVVDAEDAKP